MLRSGVDVKRGLCVSVKLKFGTGRAQKSRGRDNEQYQLPQLTIICESNRMLDLPSSTLTKDSDKEFSIVDGQLMDSSRCSHGFIHAQNSKVIGSFSYASHSGQRALIARNTLRGEHLKTLGYDKAEKAF